MPLTSRAGTSLWRTTRFCSFWMVVVMSWSLSLRWRASDCSSSWSSMAMVVSKQPLRTSWSMSNWRRVSSSHSMVRPLAS